MTEPEKHIFFRYCGFASSNTPIFAAMVNTETLQPTDVTLCSLSALNSSDGITKHSLGIMNIEAPVNSGM